MSQVVTYMLWQLLTYMLKAADTNAYSCVAYICSRLPQFLSTAVGWIAHSYWKSLVFEAGVQAHWTERRLKGLVSVLLLNSFNVSIPENTHQRRTSGTAPRPFSRNRRRTHSHSCFVCSGSVELAAETRQSPPVWHCVCLKLLNKVKIQRKSLFLEITCSWIRLGSSQ